MKQKLTVSAIIFTLLLSLLLVNNPAYAKSDATSAETKANIEKSLNLANNKKFTWSYDSNSNAWVMSIVTSVVKPVIEDEQGVSVCVPGAYVAGIDTNRDGTADVTSANYSQAVNGNMIANPSGSVTSTNGQVYTATSCPVIINTGAAGYGNSSNSTASTTYAKEGYINVACGNRGKQDTAKDADGNTYYTGDAPCCLVDQKNAVRFVKYNILLGNIPGSVDYFVSTGGSGGGAHAAMLAATSNHQDFYDYEIEAGAVGVYQNTDGSYSTTVTINGTNREIDDGVWGCMAYSAITPLYSADMAMAFEYYLDKDYSFNTDFQKKLAEKLAQKYMTYINDQNLSVKESDVDLDINGNGNKTDTIKLSIEYDQSKYPDTNGYGGTYLDFYLAEFVSDLQWYIDNIDYGDSFTWFDTNGNALSDSDVANMSQSDKAKAFIEGRYATSAKKGAMGGAPSDNAQGGPGGSGDSGSGEKPSGNPPSDMQNGQGGSGGSGDSNADEKPSGNPPSDMKDGQGDSRESKSNTGQNPSSEKAGTPDQGTTQSAASSKNSSNYRTYQAMVAAYKEDIDEIYAGDQYGKNIVNLYDPIQYIGAKTTKAPTWTRILMGASEGDMSMFSSLNMQAKWLANGTDAIVDWQWNGGHVPSEILGDSFSLYVDRMYGKHVNGAKAITKAGPTKQTKNGAESSASGKDISSWVKYTNGKVSFGLANAAAYRVEGASKAIPGFDVIDYGQEDYVFGSATKDARHWDKYVLEAFEENASELEPLFADNTTTYLIIGGVCGVIVLGIIIAVIIKKKKANPQQQDK